MVDKALFSSNKDDWETPDELFEEWNERFHFTLDVCADEVNHKVENYFSIEDDGLAQSWEGNVCWCNPPYGRKSTPQWVKKAAEEREKGITTVMLLPARTCTKWFHKYIWNQPHVDIDFIKGRLQFKGAKYKAPFPSMIVVFYG